jgi:hypothetical protein
MISRRRLCLEIREQRVPELAILAERDAAPGRRAFFDLMSKALLGKSAELEVAALDRAVT